MNVTFIYWQKMDFSICDNMVGFPKYSHIYFVTEAILERIKPSMLLSSYHSVMLLVCDKLITTQLTT